MDRQPLDALDIDLLRVLREHPRIPIVELARTLAVARGTAQARLDRLVARGVVRGFGPQVAPAALGFGVTAFNRRIAAAYPPRAVNRVSRSEAMRTAASVTAQVR